MLGRLLRQRYRLIPVRLSDTCPSIRRERTTWGLLSPTNRSARADLGEVSDRFVHLDIQMAERPFKDLPWPFSGVTQIVEGPLPVDLIEEEAS